MVRNSPGSSRKRGSDRFQAEEDYSRANKQHSRKSGKTDRGSVLVCDQSGTPWDPRDYRSDAPLIFCSNCKRELLLPRRRKTKKDRSQR
jgi:hypothetical protein